MSEDPTRESFDGRLRGVVRYGPEGPEFVVEPPSERGVEVSPAAVEIFRAAAEGRFPDDPYGPLRASIHLFEEVAVIHHPDGPERGVVATADAGAVDEPIDGLLERVAEVSDA